MLLLNVNRQIVMTMMTMLDVRHCRMLSATLIPRYGDVRGIQNGGRWIDRTEGRYTALRCAASYGYSWLVPDQRDALAESPSALFLLSDIGFSVGLRSRTAFGSKSSRRPKIVN